MRKLFPALLALALFMSFQSCRETVPPETLEDETSEQDSVDVDLGNFDDEP